MPILWITLEDSGSLDGLSQTPPSSPEDIPQQSDFIEPSFAASPSTPQSPTTKVNSDIKMSETVLEAVPESPSTKPDPVSEPLFVKKTIMELDEKQ